MDDTAVTDAALRARRGDRAAAATFVRATQHQVWLLVGHLADRGVADDLTQETFERAFAGLARFRADSSARTWLLAIARRVAADHLRRAARRPRTVAAVDDDRRPPPGLVGRADLAEGVVLRAAVDELDEDRRAAFVLTQVLGLGYAEAGAVCGCPVGTVRSRVARARADLIELLDGAADLDGTALDPAADDRTGGRA